MSSIFEPPHNERREREHSYPTEGEREADTPELPPDSDKDASPR